MFDEKITRNYQKLRAFAWSLTKDKSDSDDLLHDTILRALERKGLYTDTGTSISSWMYRIMHNLWVNKIKGTKEVIQLGLFSELLEGKSEHRADSVQQLNELSLILQSIPKPYYKAISLYIDGYTYEEIASITGKTLSAIKSDILRGRKHLKQLLYERNNIESKSN